MASAVKGIYWRIGFAFKETGQALERLGCKLQGNFSYKEKLSRHISQLQLQFDAPSVGKETFVAPSALLSGDVVLGNKSSVWYNAIVRGDFKPVTIGESTNIQDNAFVGSTSEFSVETLIGNNVSIGHGAVLKGCNVGDNVLIGINSVVSENSTIESNSVVAAGAYLPEDSHVKSGEVWAGAPAKKLRDLRPQEVEYLKTLPTRYVEMAADHSVVMKLLEHKQKEYTK